MWTITYKGFYIHGYCDRDEVSVTYTGAALPQYFKSLHAAKCRITRYLKTL
jgi:hypothetical protein